MDKTNWKVGDRVTFPCNSTRPNGGRYDGTIVELGTAPNGCPFALVVDDGWMATSEVALHNLRPLVEVA